MIPTLNSNDFRFQRRPGTPLGYRVKPNRWPNGHTQARQAGRLLTTPRSLERGWNMRDYINQAKNGMNYGEGCDLGIFIPYRNR